MAVISGQHLRIVDLPKQFGKKLLKVDLYRWTGQGWSETPWGTAENPINGKNSMWQSMVFSLAPRGCRRAAELQGVEQARLPAGRYRIRIYIDQQDRLKQDRDYSLSNADFYGEAEIDGEWAPGYQPPKIVRRACPLNRHVQ